MTQPLLKLLIWPESPASFDPNGLALIILTLPAGSSNTVARSLARETLQKLSGQLPGLDTEQLVETPRGPRFYDSTIRISLSYAKDRVLIGLSRNHALGVDIVEIALVPEIEALCRLYLPKAAALAVLETDGRDSAFAQAWAQLEACCKASGLPLAEINKQREKNYTACRFIDCEQIDGYRIAVAIIL